MAKVIESALYLKALRGDFDTESARQPGLQHVTVGIDGMHLPAAAVIQQLVLPDLRRQRGCRRFQIRQIGAVGCGHPPQRLRKGAMLAGIKGKQLPVIGAACLLGRQPKFFAPRLDCGNEKTELRNNGAIFHKKKSMPAPQECNRELQVASGKIGANIAGSPIFFMSKAKDLTKEAPSSPRVRLRGYVILARTLDKCRADLAGKIGDYHFDCPLDNMLFSFKHLKGEDFRKAVETAETDDDVAYWVDRAGTPRSDQEIKEWSDEIEGLSFYNHPEKGEWFAGECRALGLDPATSTLFDYLEADDAASFKK